MEDFRKHIIPHDHAIRQEDRIQRNGFKPKLIWFTGLSGSGKSTLASGLEVYLFNEGYYSYILDGDNVRKGLNQDLDFTEASRKENIRRIAEVSNLFLDAGFLVLTAFISPFKEDREAARSLVGRDNFIEVYVDCPLEVCEQRDVKGLYKKAKAGEIAHFTGISSPFEAPEHPDLIISTAENTFEDCLEQLTQKVASEIIL